MIPVEENEGNDDQMDDGNENADDSERDPMAEILYKFFHLKAFDSSGWFLFIGTSVSQTPIFVDLDQETKLVVESGSCNRLFFGLLIFKKKGGRLNSIRSSNMNS